MPETKESYPKNPLQVEHFSEDLLGREKYCRSLEDYLNIEHEFTDGSLVVSLNASFGQGKSTLLKMWENDLSDRRKKDKNTPLVINLNAWDSDYYGEPLIPIISELVDAISKTLPPENDKTERLWEAAKDVAWFCSGLVVSASQVDPFAAQKLAESKKGDREKQRDVASLDLLNDYRKRKYAIWRLKRLLKETLGGRSPRALIFTDELDRCRPDYAVSYLETIKHVFDIHGLVFVLAIDYDHLKNSACSLYGDDLNFPEYFRKFIHRSFEMPDPKAERKLEFARELTNFYLNNKNNRFSKLNLKQSWRRLPELIIAFNMTPRQAIESFRLLGHLSSSRTDYPIELLTGYGIAMMFMCSLKATGSELYKLIGLGEKPHEQVLMIFQSAFIKKKAYRMFMTYLSGYTDASSAYSLLKKHDLLPDGANESTLQEELNGHIMNLWDHQIGDYYPQIYKQIEATELE